MRTKEEILSIASDLREGSMTTNEACKQLLCLLEPKQREVSEELINDVDKLILKWLNSKSENVTQLSFDIVQYFKSKTK
jgi:hypothetical protein